MSEELREYFKIAIGIYKNILELESVEIKEGSRPYLHWSSKSCIGPKTHCAFGGEPRELKQFLDELIS